jgi:hypothetical protein
MAAFVTGTLTFFQQTSAPTGWTKQTTNTDYTLRVVSGSGSTTINNSVNFSTGMVDATFTGSGSMSGSTSSDAADLPTHNHSVSMYVHTPGPHAMKPSGAGVNTAQAAAPTAFGPNTDPGPHSHSISGSAVPVTGGPGLFAVRYVDFILASKV